jgi:predicted polyphosphate/ATP-dependent NAD kinase
LVASDCGEGELLELVAKTPSHAVVTVIGGQGFLLGRGNQQISAAVIRQLAEPRLLVAATQAKLLALSGPLLIDTGDARLDSELAGFHRVITSSQDSAIAAAVAASAPEETGEEQ